MTDPSTENKQAETEDREIDEAQPIGSEDPAEAKAKQPERKHRSGSVWLIAGLGIGAIALLFFAYLWWRHNSTYSYTNDASVTNHIHPVNPRISGKVAEVLVDDNQIVTKGQPLVKLDPRDYQVQLQQAEANLAAAKKQAQVAQANIALASKNARAQNTQAYGEIDAALASLANSEAAVAAAKANIPEAEAQLASIEADIQKTKADYARYQFLYDRGVTSAQQLDLARTTYEQDVASKDVAIKKIKQAQKQYQESRDSVAAAKGQLETRRGDLEAAASTKEQIEVNRRQYEATLAKVTQAEAAVENARLQLNYTNIAADTSGRVGNKTVRVGQEIQPGQTLMSVVPTNSWVIANFKETDLKQMRVGQPVKISIDSLGGQIFWGRINSIAPASGAEFSLLPPMNATGNFIKIVQRVPVKILFDPQSVKGYENLIVPGISVEVSVVINGGTKRLDDGGMKGN